MPVPNTFGTATSAIPLSQLDANFATPITIGNTAVQLGNTVTTLNNMTLANVTISSGTITITNVSVTTANVSGTANVSTLVVVGNETVGGNTTITGNITAANANVTTNLVLSGGTANGVAYLNTNKVLTTGSALVFDGSNLLVGSSSLRSSAKLDVLGNIAFGANATYYGQIGYNAGVGALDLTSGDGAFRFIRQSGSVTSMTLDSSGNLGIGITSPTSRLHVSNTSASSNAIAQFTNGTTGFAAGNGLYVGIDSTNTATIFNFYNSALQFGTNGILQMVLSTTGNLGLGVISTPGWGTSYRSLDVRSNGASFAGGDYSAFVGANIYNDNTNWRYKGASYKAVLYSQFNGAHTWSTDNGTPSANGVVTALTSAMTLDASGNLLVGTTEANPALTGVTGVGIGPTGGIRQSSGSGASYFAVTGTSGTHIQFYTYNSGAVAAGLISSSGSTTTYAASSDYRLKDIEGPVIGAKDFIMALQPKQGTWKADGSKFVGFLAHEFQEVSPSSVIGVKDAVDEDGNPVMQAMQASSAEVMANLVSFVQELKAEIDSLKSQLNGA